MIDKEILKKVQKTLLKRELFFSYTFDGFDYSNGGFAVLDRGKYTTSEITEDSTALVYQAVQDLCRENKIARDKFAAGLVYVDITWDFDNLLPGMFVEKIINEGDVVKH